ncbi:MULTISPECIES: hypothetical protein [Nostoc cyanobionts]|nr:MULTISPECIES: hypothetical protein [unclassified Nostoc]
MTKINICHSIFVKKLFGSCLISGAVVAIAHEKTNRKGRKGHKEIS